MIGRVPGIRFAVFPAWLLLAALSCLAGESVGGEVVRFDIPASPAHRGLNLFARDADIQILYPFDRVQGVQVNELVGDYTIEEGMRKLIDGTCLGLSKISDTQMTLSVENTKQGFWFMKKDYKGCTRVKLLSALSAAIVSGLSAGQALGQESGGQVASSSSLEEIIVTAQRRQERLEDVPMAIVAVTPKLLERASITSLEDLGRVAPGVMITRAGSFTQPSIRGVSSLTLGFGVENNVATYVDGVYQPDMISINTDLVNVAGIQVLKGPQGTLYGRNATGGAIVINTLDPTDEFEGRVKATFGRWDGGKPVSSRGFHDQRLQGYLSGPLTENLGFIVSGNIRDTDGYIRDIGADPFSSHDDVDIAPMNDDSLRAKLQWTPSDDLTVTLGYSYSNRLDARGTTYRVTEYPAAFLPPPPGRATEPDTVSLNTAADSSVRTNQVSANIAWQTGIGTLTSITAYMERNGKNTFDFDGSKADITRSVGEELEQSYFQQSLDFAIDSVEDFDIVLGMMYTQDDLQHDDLHAYQNFVQTRSSWFNPKGEAWAVYGDVTWNFSESWYLTGGARYSYEKREYSYKELTPAGDPHPTILPGDDSENFNKLTPRVVLRYELNPGSNIYASYTGGFRSGAYNPTVHPSPVLNVPIDQEEVDAFEVGFKTVGSYVRLDAAAFYYDYENFQVGATRPNPISDDGSVVQVMFNADKAEIYGAEAQLTYTPTDALNIWGGLAYLHAEYKDFEEGWATGLNSATQTNAGGQLQDWSGQQMVRSPEWTFNVGFDYTVPFAQGLLTFAGNGYYTDSYVVQNPSLYGPLADPALQNKQRYRQSGYALFNGHVEWTDSSDRFTLGLYGKNLTNKRYKMTYSGSAFGDFAQLSDPRSYGVEVGYRF